MKKLNHLKIQSRLQSYLDLIIYFDPLDRPQEGAVVTVTASQVTMKVLDDMSIPFKIDGRKSERLRFIYQIKEDMRYLGYYIYGDSTIEEAETLCRFIYNITKGQRPKIKNMAQVDGLSQLFSRCGHTAHVSSWFNNKILVEFSFNDKVRYNGQVKL